MGPLNNQAVCVSFPKINSPVLLKEVFKRLLDGDKEQTQGSENLSLLAEVIKISQLRRVFLQGITGSVSGDYCGDYYWHSQSYTEWLRWNCQAVSIATMDTIVRLTACVFRLIGRRKSGYTVTTSQQFWENNVVITETNNGKNKGIEGPNCNKSKWILFV